MEESRKYFEKHLIEQPVTSTVNTLPGEEDLSIKTSEKARTEVELEIKSLKSLKSSGIDFVASVRFCHQALEQKIARQASHSL